MTLFATEALTYVPHSVGCPNAGNKRSRPVLMSLIVCFSLLRIHFAENTTASVTDIADPKAVLTAEAALVFVNPYNNENTQSD